MKTYVVLVVSIVAIGAASELLWQLTKPNHESSPDREIEEILKLQQTTRKLLEEYTALNANRNQRERTLAMTAAYAAHYMGTNGHSWEHASNKVWTAITTNLP